MKFDEFVRKVKREYPNQVWSFVIDDGIYIAECDDGFIAYNPDTDNTVIGVNI